MTELRWWGVWLSDAPLDSNEGVWGDTRLVIESAIDVDTLSQFEWVEMGKPYREWFVPAALLNGRCSVRLAEPDEE